MGSSCNLLVCLEQGPPLELCKRPGVSKFGPSCRVQCFVETYKMKKRSTLIHRIKQALKSKGRFWLSAFGCFKM